MFEIAEVIGIIAFSISGFFVGVRKKLDMLGVLTATFLTAFGGGIARDLAVDIKPYIFTHSFPAIIMISVMALLFMFKFHTKDSIENKSYFVLSDSIGLISFSITGALIAVEHDMNLTGTMVLAFLTAAGGGIARDVIINEVPFVLKTGFYGTIALIIAIIIFILNEYALVSLSSLIIIFVSMLALRMLAYYKKWSIPLPK
jgi:uncharacterized membrane protein YeiH